MSEAYKDYFCNQAIQPALDNLLNNLNPVSVTLLHQRTVGLGFNTTELYTNADANVLFIGLHLPFHNMEGATRGLAFVNLANMNIFFSNNVASALSINYILITYGFAFHKIRVSTTAGVLGAVTNAATSIQFTGWRIHL